MFWFALLVAFRFWRFQWTKNAFRLIFLRSFDSSSFFGRQRVEKGGWWSRYFFFLLARPNAPCQIYAIEPVTGIGKKDQCYQTKRGATSQSAGNSSS
uniref:Putative secreted peptide n=1 Tax=Anopheles braziliensis TaxID=58242 RepID=A0A2M3ZVD3_9DIPT